MPPEIAEPSCGDISTGSMSVFIRDKKIPCPQGFRIGEVDGGNYCTKYIPQEFLKNIRSDCSRYYTESKLAFYQKELPGVSECPFENMSYDVSTKACTLRVDMSPFRNFPLDNYCRYWKKSGYMGFYVDYLKTDVLSGLMSACPLPFEEGHVWQESQKNHTSSVHPHSQTYCNSF
jgi:hypothetical protein